MNQNINGVRVFDNFVAGLWCETKSVFYFCANTDFYFCIYKSSHRYTQVQEERAASVTLDSDPVVFSILSGEAAG